MAKLAPTLREKKRYLVYETSVSPRDSVSRIEERFTTLFGVVQAGEAHIQYIKSSKTRVMLSVNRQFVDKLKASLSMSSTPLYTIGVSGMINKADSYLR